jgi:two-component system NarL family sensor kinase
MGTAGASSRAWAPTRHAAGWAAAALLATAIGSAAGILVLIHAHEIAPSLRDGLISSVSYLIPYGIVGAFLIRRRPDLPFGWLLAGTAAVLAVAIAVSGPAEIAVHRGNTSTLTLSGLVVGNLGFVQIGVQGLINVRFPSGQVTSRWGHLLNRLMIIGLTLGLIGGLLGGTLAQHIASDGVRRNLANPLTGGTTIGRIADGLDLAIPVVVLLGLIAGVGIILRARHAEGIERQQLRWRALGVVLSLVTFPFAVISALPTFTDALDGVVFVTTLVVPVMRYGLWEIDTVIRRSAAYALVTIVLVGCYVPIATVGVALASERIGFLLASIAVVAAYGPARSRSQRVVDRYFYGNRNDPYQVLTDIGRRLEAAAEPGAVLSAVVSAVAESLRLPYVAIERPGDGELLAVYGDTQLDAPERWPLTYQGATVGTLTASSRRGESELDHRDRVVLSDLARQAGAAVYAEGLTADLVESRQRLVNAREEERRRLRRDLHDGLGPLLTGLGLNLDAARAQLKVDNSTVTDSYLARAKDASSQAISDLRGIVHGLRPPALDDLGLAGAIRLHVERLVEGSQVQVDIEAADLPELPAAVEVAAFRTVVEGVNNAIRHANARTCTVRLDVEDAAVLVIEVRDDGVQVGDWTAGVGLLAMRERASELGGELAAGPVSGGGRVCARLPLAVTVEPMSAS